MNILYLSSKNPVGMPEYGMLKDWAGRHGVWWAGAELYAEMEACHCRTRTDGEPFNPADYVQAFGVILSHWLQGACFDVLLCRDDFFLSGLVTDIPVVCLKDGELPSEDSLAACCEPTDSFMPVYAINLKERTDRRAHICAEFAGRKEFAFHLVDACKSADGRTGLWNSMVHIVRQAKEEGEEFVLIAEDDHFFTKYYSPKLWMQSVVEAHRLGADILSGGIGGFGTALPRGSRLYEVDWFWCTQFIVVYASMFNRMLDYKFGEKDTADGVLSAIAPCKMVVYPFVSEQWDAGYSDVTPTNRDNPGRIREHFAWANRKFQRLLEIFQMKGMPLHELK